MKINEGKYPNTREGRRAAAGECYGVYDKWKKKNKEKSEYVEFTLEVPLISYPVFIEQEEKEKKTTNNHAIAIIGDRFYQGAFLSWKELKKSASLWENTLHDINHMGTTSFQGFMVRSDIRFFVGYNNNVQTYEKDKSIGMDINISEKTAYAEAWHGYVDLCQEAEQIPNVSVSFRAQVKEVKASELPEGTNFADHGYDKDSLVIYIYNIQPQALSTVFRGQCSDKEGCGIGKCKCKK